MGQGLRVQTVGVAPVALSPGSLFVVIFAHMTPGWTAILRIFACIISNFLICLTQCASSAVLS